MFLATSNPSKKLLYLCFVGRVSAADLEREQAGVLKLLAELPAGFRLLTDLSRLDSMEVACAAEIGRVMEACEQKGVGLVVRVIPDPAKDIGMSLLSIFHYHHHPRTVTCATLAEAGDRLGL